MHRTRLLAVVSLAVMLLSVGSYAVVADDPILPQVSEPVLVESSRVEWVMQQSPTGEEERVPVTVHEVTAMEEVIIPKEDRGDNGNGGVAPLSVEYPGGVSVTLERSMDWYEFGDFWRVWSRGRTYTTYGTCTGGCNVYVGHQYWDGNHWLTAFWGEKFSEGPCHNDSTLAIAPADLYYAGTWHQTHGVHVVYVDGERHEYDRIGPGPYQVP